MKRLQQEQKDFLTWVLRSFDLPKTAVYKVRGILKFGNYNENGVGILNNIREIYGHLWLIEKKTIQYKKND